jgi:hypothetical protein
VAKYQQVYDGDWEPCIKRNGREMCCDCGLVHWVDYRIKNGVIEQRVRRDQARTYAARRRMHIRVVRVIPETNHI